MGLFQKIFGGSNSGNKAYKEVSAAMSPLMQYASEGASGLSALLGGDSSGLNSFMRATGYDPAAEGVSRGITGNAAAGGLLRSGSTARGLYTAGNELKSQFAGNYMQQLLGLAGLGNNAASAITGAGNYSSSQTGALGKMATSALSMFSDPRLKMNVEKFAEYPDGLGVYAFSYIWEDPDAGPQHVGVMADEVEALRPWALGPEEDGFQTVNYAKIFDRN